MSASQHMRWTIQAASAAGTRGSRSGWSRWTRPETRTLGAAAARWPTRWRPYGQQPLSTTTRHWAKAGPNPKDTAGEDPPNEGKETLSHLLETRKTPLIALGLGAAVIGGYVVMLIISMTKGAADPDPHADGCCAPPSGRPLDLRQGRISALVFDKELNRPESLMGVAKLRRLMGGLARGHVLEVAVGTGRNIEYVDWEEIRASAPPVPQWAEDGSEVTRGVKSELQLERERVLRRVQKGEKGMILPGDETPEVVSYTGVDVSTDVLEVAWGKLRKAVPELIPRRRRRTEEEMEAEQQQQQARTASTGKAKAAVAPPSAPAASSADETLAANIGQGRIHLYKSDAQVRLPAPPAVVSHDSSRVLPAPRYYDTILQNFGLCSVSDPHALLANMAAVLRPDSGRIYLLEHGRGSYGWLNGLLDKFAPRHFERYGCWWNRDIEEIIRRAEREVPGLEVVRVERPLWLQGGTMLWIELRVSPGKARGEIGGKGE